MKKILLSVFAVAALASCIQNETINPKTPIGFGDAFVNNSTKAIYEGTNYVKAFQVWGTVTPNGGTALPLYEGANVKDTAAEGVENYGEAWECDVTRFWTPDCDYNFYAVVDSRVATAAGTPANVNVTAQNGVPREIAYTADGQNDLLYGATTKSTQGGLAEPGDIDGALVKFVMKHLLSRIQFTFVNGVTLESGDKAAYTFKVTSLSVSGLWKQGKYTIAATPTKWERVGSESLDLSFVGNYETGAASEGKVIIPGNQTLTISYDYEVYFDNDTTDATEATKMYETATPVEKSLTYTFAENTAYNITATLTAGTEITFTIQEVGAFAGPTDTQIQ